MAATSLSVARLRELLHYDPDTGVFTWNKTRRGPKTGGRCGGLSAYGYLTAMVDGRCWRLHRLAFLYMEGRMPQGDVDHINGVRSDNRWGNLREATRAVNMQNQRVARSNNSTGLLGVNRHGAGSKRFRARIKSGGKMLSLGTFDTAEEAHAAYLAAKRRLHEGCTI